jgi:hypothetical protein
MKVFNSAHLIRKPFKWVTLSWYWTENPKGCSGQKLVSKSLRKELWSFGGRNLAFRLGAIYDVSSRSQDRDFAPRVHVQQIRVAGNNHTAVQFSATSKNVFFLR